MHSLAPSTPAPASPGGLHVWKVAVIALLAVAAALATALDRARWGVHLVDARFVDHREKIAGGGAALNITGYAVVRVETRHDIFKVSRDENSYPEVQATLCDSGQPVGAWRDPLPLERDEVGRRFVYALLIPARHNEAELAQGGDLCVRLLTVGASMTPWAQSRTLRVALPADVREQLLAYGRRKGVVDVTLDTVCAPRLCQPE